MSIWKKTIAAASPKLQRLLLRLSKYDVEIEYLQGKENVIADALWRANLLPPTQQDYEVEIIPVHIVSKTVPVTATRLQVFRHSTKNDSTLTKLKHALHTGWPVCPKDCGPELKDYWTYPEEISIEDGILFKGHRWIVPTSERQSTLKILHIGQYGIDKITLQARESVFWPGISNDIKTPAETCTVCQENSISQPNETQQPTEIPLHALERLGIDLLELNKEHFLLVVDYCRRFPILRKLNNLSTATTLLHLKQISSEYGIPKTVVTV